MIVRLPAGLLRLFTGPLRRSHHSSHRVRGGRLFASGWLVVLLFVSTLSARAAVPAPAAPFVPGSATSSVASCLQVGSTYLSGSATPNVYEQDVYLYWTGTITSARLVGYEFNASGISGRTIKVNNVPIGNTTGQRNSESRCLGFEGRESLSWTISDPAILKQGRNTLRIEINPSQTGETSWGISRAQIEVTGVDVDGRHYSQVTIDSSYFNNWSPYRDEGTWTHIMEPQGYDGSQPTPLLISVHGFGSQAWESMQDFHDAAAARGWLLASADYHGEVWNDFYVTDSSTGLPAPGVGRRSMGSRAAQWDIQDILNYMQPPRYNVDPTRIYLVGHSMGSLTALLAGARFADRFAAVVSDSAPTDLAAWEDETQTEDPKGATPNASINLAIRTETGVYLEPTHYPDPGKTRQAPDYPFEYERRSPIEWSMNYQHLPLWILHPASDQKVLPHHAEDMYLVALQTNPDHVERTYFPGGHGDRINGAEFANTQLDWLAQFSRPVNQAPQELNFALDWSGSHFWMSVQMSNASLNEAHWLRVTGARYDQRLQTIEADIENLKPQSGDPAARGVVAPKNMPVTLTFDLAAIGLPAAGTYTAELVNKGDGSLDQAFPVAVDGKVQVTVPQGNHILKLSAGGNPPNTSTLSLRQGVGGYAGTQDTYLSQWDPGANYASATTLSLRSSGYEPNHTGLLRFDLAGLPAGAKVRFATLTVRMTGYPNYVLPFEVDAVVRPWKVDEATWLSASAGTSWTQPGAGNVPLDRAGRVTDVRTVYPSYPYLQIADRYGFNVTDFVRGWVAEPSSNQGFVFRVDLPDGVYGSAKDGFSIASADFGSWGIDRRPLLTVIYTLDDFTPTPTATATATVPPQDGQIVGLVFLDGNRNGSQDTGEAGVADRLVQLKRDGVIQDNVTTGADGRYHFDSVQPGTWQVVLSTPPNYQVTTAAGNPASTVVAAGSVAQVDFGIALSAATPTPTTTPCPDCDRTYLPLILRGDG